jgi:hypothetical protein
MQPVNFGFDMDSLDQFIEDMDLVYAVELDYFVLGRSHVLELLRGMESTVIHNFIWSRYHVNIPCYSHNRFSCIIGDVFTCRSKGRLIVDELYKVWENLCLCFVNPRDDVMVNDVAKLNLRILLTMFLMLDTNDLEFPLYADRDQIRFIPKFDDWTQQAGFPGMSLGAYKSSIFKGAHFFC